MANRVELRVSERIPFAEAHAFADTGPYERLRDRLASLTSEAIALAVLA